MAAATAVRAAALGHRTIVVGVDRAHNLGDVLGTGLGSTPVEVATNLLALEADPQAEHQRQWGALQGYFARFFEWAGLGGAEAEEIAIFPGLEELLLLTRVAEIVETGAHDLVHIRLLRTTGEGPRFIRVTLRVGGFADAVIGPVTSMRRDELARIVDLGDAVTTVAMTIDRPHEREVRDLLAARPDIARVEDTGAMRARMTELMSLGWVIIGAMLLFGSVLAAAILFSTATLGVLERRRDLATLRAIGRTLRELVLALTLEHALLAILGIAIGIPLARATTRYLVHAFSSDLFALPFVISPLTLTITVAGVFVMVLVAQWPALRSVARMSLAESVRSREG